jgi:ligand-binding sensor domain-containing protein
MVNLIQLCIVVENKTIKPLNQPYKSIFLLRITLLLIGLSLQFSFTLIAQEEIKANLNTINYSIKDGLPSNETYDVFQDSQGFMWIGTDNGVVKYNGSEFKTYTTNDGLTDNTIFKINEDRHGRIWFMTYNRKLSYFLKGKFYPFEFNDELSIALKDFGIDETITHFYLDSEETVHLCLVNFTTVNISAKGLINIKALKNRSENVSFNFPGSDLEQVFSKILPHLKNTPKHEKFIIQNKKWGHLHFFTKGSTTYIGTSEGLKYIHKGSTTIQRSLLEEYNITGIESDFEGGMWCSTLKNGVLYIPNPHITFFKTNSDGNNSIEAIVPQNDLLIFSMSKKRIDNWFLDSNNQYLKKYYLPLVGSKIPLNVSTTGLKFEHHVMFKNIGSPILAVLNIKKGELNYFTNYSILTEGVLSHKELKKLDFSNSILKENVMGEKWIAFREKLIMIKKSHPNIFNSAIMYLHDFKVLKPIRTSSGEVLLATTNGLYYLNEENRIIQPYPKFHEFTEFRIQDIIETADSSLVFATKANGIYIWKNNFTSHYTKNEGLLSNTVNQLAYTPSSNTIWVAGNNGINSLTKNASNQWVPQSVITKYDGLESQDIRSLYFYNDYLSFINSTGMNLVPIEYLKPDSIPPFLYTQGVLVNNEAKGLNSLLSLPYDSNNISFTLEAISYKTKNSILYTYQLLPNNNIWQQSKSNQLNFNALAPGDYTLKVKSTNFHGLSSKIQTIQFSIIPAFWMTIWFYLLVISISLFLVFLVSNYFIRIYKNQAKFERSLKEMHVVSLQSKMNPHFIFNSLNSIQNYILKNEKIKANEYLLEFSTLIRHILQNSESTSITLEKELSTLRLYVNLEKRRIREDFIYLEEVDPNIDADNCTIPTLLIQPYIENAIWHGQVYTNPKGQISVKIIRSDKALFFEIIDNGIGIENAEKSKVKSNKHKSIGSEATKKRIQLLSELNNEITEVQITSLNPMNAKFTGTKITFSVPWKKLSRIKNTNVSL